MKILSFLFFLFLTAPAFAQYTYFENNQDTYVFADTAYVRNAPSTSGKTIDTLFAADKIIVLETTKKDQTIRGIKAPWLKISYSKNKQQTEGYIWSGLLAATPLRKGETKFVFGINRIFRKDTVIILKDDPEHSFRDTIQMMMLEIKVFKGNERITSFKRSIEYADYSSATISGNKGLNNLENILAISFGGEACAVPMTTYFYGYGNNQILPLVETMNVGDAGNYYHKENLIFPSDKGGQPSIVLFKEQTDEATDKNDKNGEPVFKTTKSAKTLLWDGIKLTEQKKVKK